MSGSRAAAAAEHGPESFPRQYARTRRFTLGAPRNISVSPDGRRVLFLRSPRGDDPVTGLWTLDVASGEERLLCDPRDLADTTGEDLAPAERARRERVRESAAGIVSYATDRDLRTVAFALAGGLFITDAETRETRSLPASAPVFDPRPDAAGRLVAYVSGRALRVVSLDGADRELASEEDEDISWGVAEFVAAEEMDRARGYWWDPDSAAIAAARVDERGVLRWHIADPAVPSEAPRQTRYPAAGSANADVSLWMLGLDGPRTQVRWDQQTFPYLARVVWDAGRPLTLLVQSRDQRTTRIVTVDAASGETTTLREERDPDWVDLPNGVPAWLADGRLVSCVDRDDTRRIAFDDRTVTPDGLHVRDVLHVGAHVIFSASEDPTEVHVWRLGADGELTRLTDGAGVHSAAAGGSTVVVSSSTMEADVPVTHVQGDGGPPTVISSNVEPPVVSPEVRMLRLGERDLRAALLLPRDGGTSRLPVLLDPYGGPHFQRVVAARGAFLLSQWLADQGFAVLVVDGRGTPGRGREWERAVGGDLATPALEDQVDALHAAATQEPRLDLDRVGIRGWSFGGYLAALAVLRRPDVFHAAVAGAPVTDWRLYDTHYTERYLGDPERSPEAYRKSSLIDDAERLERPLMLIHGMADDNVVVAHTLRLSSALLAAGRPHSVLPLVGVTHMTPQEVVAENLLRLQVAFLHKALSR